MIAFAIIIMPSSLLLPNSGNEPFIEMLGVIQKSLDENPNILVTIIPKLENLIKNGQPASDPNKSAYFCLNHALVDFRILDNLKKNDNKRYETIIQNLNFMRYPDFLNKLCSANQGAQKSLIFEFEKNKNNLRLLFNKGSFLEFACLKTLISIRAGEIFLDETNRISTSEEIKQACLPFEEAGWSNNLFFCIFKTLAETSPASLIPCDESYKKKVDYLNGLLKIRYPQIPTHSLIIFCSEMHYFKTKKNYKEAIQIFKKIPQDLVSLDQKDLIDPLVSVEIYSILAESYWNEGNRNFAKIYQEIALSLCVSNLNLGFNVEKKRTLVVAEKLRKYYKEEGDWMLLRNLENRSIKIGMEPLPKQSGEK